MESEEIQSDSGTGSRHFANRHEASIVGTFVITESLFFLSVYLLSHVDDEVHPIICDVAGGVCLLTPVILLFLCPLLSRISIALSVFGLLTMIYALAGIFLPSM